VLTAYLQLYQPALEMLAEQYNMPDLARDKLLTPSAAALAVTWRQVRRIMLSLCVVVFAYWHGELLHDEASRYLAITRLLLEYPRSRWGEALNEAVQTLFDISRLGNFTVCKHLQTLLPGQNEKFVAMLCDRTPMTKQNEDDSLRHGTEDVAVFGVALWPTVDAFPWSNDFPVFGNSTAEDEDLLNFSGNYT
jgi:hypothetical protein